MKHHSVSAVLSAMTIAVLLVVAGCGGDDDNVNAVASPTSTVARTPTVTARPSATPTVAPASITVIHSDVDGGSVSPQRRNVPASVTTFRFTGRTRVGESVFGPILAAKARTVVLNAVPREVGVLQIDYLTTDDVAADRVGAFTTSIDLSGGHATITDPALVDTTDPVTFSLVSFGCNRVSSDALATNSPSSANVGQLTQDFAEIIDTSHLNPTPKYLFFTGDLVLNLATGTDTLTSQLQGWKALYDSTPFARGGVQLIASAGNHEMLVELKVTPTPGAADAGSSADVKIEIPNPPTGAVFTSEMSTFIPASNGPTQAAPNPDGVQRDESMLSFTFQDGGNFFMVVNTDTYVGGDTPEATGHIPLNWIQAHLASANSDATVENIFVFGHRPIASPDSDNTGIAAAEALAFYNLLAAPNGTGVPTKVRAYICAHAHLWAAGVPSNAPAGSTLPQVIAGNAGSDVAKEFAPPIGYYGYTVFAVTHSGAITLEGWGRPIPTPYAAPAPQPPTTLREQMTVYAPSQS